TFDDALLALSRITYLYYEANGHRFVRLPKLDDLQTSIFKALGPALLSFLRQGHVVRTPFRPPRHLSSYTQWVIARSRWQR
ncbi:MAG: hypothetical protein M3495_14895, partial [Pseudomonadota bacterium]|nr:hypothetical protein [Pseudomonadota bacterium]